MSASNGFQSSAYANDRPPSVTGGGDTDVATDPASSSFFLNDYKKLVTKNVPRNFTRDTLITWLSIDKRGRVSRKLPLCPLPDLSANTDPNPIILP